MKYADNIVKCFAAALAILSGTLLSVPIFGFELSPIFSLGVACTISASVLYSWAPEPPQLCVKAQPEQEMHDLDPLLDLEGQPASAAPASTEGGGTASGARERASFPPVTTALVELHELLFKPRC